MPRNAMTKYLGNDYRFSVRFTMNGEPIDITGWKIFYTIKNRIVEADSLAEVAKVVTSHTDAVQGITLIEVDGADTRDLEPGEYHWDIQAVDADGKVKTIVRDTIQFLERVTLRIS